VGNGDMLTTLYVIMQHLLIASTRSARSLWWEFLYKCRKFVVKIVIQKQGSWGKNYPINVRNLQWKMPYKCKKLVMKVVLQMKEACNENCWTKINC
jgi:hypothetical protein